MEAYGFSPKRDFGDQTNSRGPFQDVAKSPE
jgi:hypothetical protein